MNRALHRTAFFEKRKSSHISSIDRENFFNLLTTILPLYGKIPMRQHDWVQTWFMESTHRCSWCDEDCKDGLRNLSFKYLHQVLNQAWTNVANWDIDQKPGRFLPVDGQTRPLALFVWTRALGNDRTWTGECDTQMSSYSVGNTSKRALYRLFLVLQGDLQWPEIRSGRIYCTNY